jgi:cobalt-zinc-cadmium efflux system protein
MEHHHNRHRNIRGKNLLASSVLNFTITIVEIAGGLASNSLALLSDALHNLGDTLAVFLAYMAHIISKKKYTDKKTFGYKRIEILAALFNAIVLIVITIFLFTEAFKRIMHPEPVRGNIMLIVAAVGLVANIISVVILKRDSHYNINVRAAYLHLLGDTVSSVAVITGAVFIRFFALYRLDPLVTFVVGSYILKETWAVLKQAGDILMQGTPGDLNLTEVKQALEDLPEIDNIHHVHAWNLNDNEIHFECHVDLKDDIRISQTEKIKEKIHEILLDKFNVSHVTIQYEFNSCDNKEMIHSR